MPAPNTFQSDQHRKYQTLTNQNESIAENTGYSRKNVLQTIHEF